MAQSRPSLRTLTGVLPPVLATCLTALPLSPQQQFSVTDSAGVHIVESSIPARSAGAEWRLGSEPVLTIGEDAGDLNTMFQGVSQAFRTASGLSPGIPPAVGS